MVREHVSSCARERSSVQSDNTRNGARYARSTHSKVRIHDVGKFFSVSLHACALL